jgi:hypothetical protein
MLRVALPLLCGLALLAGCGDDEEAPAAGGAALTGPITFALSGGDAFRDDRITVEADGGATVETREGEQRAELTADELAQVGAEAEALAGAESAVTRPPEPDMVSYRFTYGGRAVETDDPAMPEDLAPLIRTFVGLIDKYGSP